MRTASRHRRGLPQRGQLQVLILLAVVGWTVSPETTRYEAAAVDGGPAGIRFLALAEPPTPWVEPSGDRVQSHAAGSARRSPTDGPVSRASGRLAGRPGRRPELGCGSMTESPWRGGMPFRAPPLLD